MSSFLLAIQFLTTLPLKLKNFNPDNSARAVIYFPVVGLLLGLLLVGIDKLLFNLGFSSLAANIILVVTLIAVTGGIHLDGLADTADAFLSGRKKEEMLQIMRDPHIGAMGVLSLISVILLKIGLLSSLSNMKPAVLILMCILSRWSAAFQIYLFPYARQEGKAKLFTQGMNLKIFMIAAVITVICSALILQRGGGLIILLIVSGLAYLAGRRVTKKIGGVTGDTLGAVIELTEVAVLLIVGAGQGVING